MHLIISCSINRASKSRMMAKYAYNLYCKDAKFIDLQKIELPLCDGDKCYDEPIVEELKGYLENNNFVGLSEIYYPNWKITSHDIDIIQIEYNIMYHYIKSVLVESIIFL